MLGLVGAVVAGSFGLGHWLGMARTDLDRDYLAALEIGGKARDARIEDLTRALADAELGQSVDEQAARSLRDTISKMRDDMAGLREEVTFYKSLMAPSSLERGLQIAEFDVGDGEHENQFSYHLLLTQAEERRSWIQGSVELEVHGVRAAADGSSVEEVLGLTELTDVDEYPLHFRFRYFQDLAGLVSLPKGFRPRAVVITATPKGRSEPVQRSFDWRVQSG